MKQTYITVLATLLFALSACDTEIKYRGEYTEPLPYITANIDLDADSAMIYVGQTSFFLTDTTYLCNPEAIVTITHNSKEYYLEYQEPDPERGPYMNYDDELTFYDYYSGMEYGNNGGFYTSPSEGDYNRRYRPTGYFLWLIPDDIRPADTLRLTVTNNAGLKDVVSEIIVPYPISVSLEDRKLSPDSSRLRLSIVLDREGYHSGVSATDEVVSGFSFTAHNVELYRYSYSESGDSSEVYVDTVQNDRFYSKDPLFMDASDMIGGEESDVHGYEMASTEDVQMFPYSMLIELPYFDKNDYHYDSYTRLLSSTIYIQTISLGKYRHNLTRDEASYANGNPFAEPVLIYSNIEGGAGYFGVTWGRELKIRGDTAAQF